MRKELTNQAPIPGKPYSLKGREDEIAELRAKGWSWHRIGVAVGCTGQGAKDAYVRWLKQREAA